VAEFLDGFDGDSFTFGHPRRTLAGNSNEIVGDRGEDEKPFDQFPFAMSGLAQASYMIHPNGFSIRFRLSMLVRWRGPRADCRAAMALFCATCDMQQRSRQTSTMSSRRKAPP